MPVIAETTKKRRDDGTIERVPIGWKVRFKIDGVPYCVLDPRTGRTRVWPLHKKEDAEQANRGVLKRGKHTVFADQIAARTAKAAAPVPQAERATIRSVWASRQAAILVKRSNEPLGEGTKRQVCNQYRDEGPLMRLLGDIPLQQLTRFHVEDFLAALIQDHADTPRMREHQAGALRRVLAYCERTKDFGMEYPLSPLIRVPKAKRQREPNRLTPEELVKILLYCQEHAAYRDSIALLAFMYYRGGRVGEFSALRTTSFQEGRDRQWVLVDAEIDHEDGVLVPRVKTESSERFIVICEDLREFARRHTATHPSVTVTAGGFVGPQTLIFSQTIKKGSRKGELVPRSYNSVRNMLEHVGVGAIGRPLRSHDFRHSFTTEFKGRLIRSGLDPLVVKRILGHTSNDITDLYDGSDPRFDPAYVRAAEVIQERMRQAGIGALL
jgi:integrase